MEIAKMDKEDNPSPGSKERWSGKFHHLSRLQKIVSSSVNRVSVDAAVLTSFRRSMNSERGKITSLVSLTSN